MSELIQLKAADEKTLEEINLLLRDLSQSPEKRTCSLPLLKSIVESSESELWMIRDGGEALGMATLALIHKPGGLTARIEDVVVLERARGKGFGRMLVGKLIERAKAREATLLQLNSRPTRVAANALYRKLGFQLHSTNTYHMQL